MCGRTADRLCGAAGVARRRWLRRRQWGQQQLLHVSEAVHQSNTNKEHTRQGFCKTNKNNREQTVGFLKMLFKLNLTAAPRV